MFSFTNSDIDTYIYGFIKIHFLIMFYPNPPPPSIPPKQVNLSVEFNSMFPS